MSSGYGGHYHRGRGGRGGGRGGWREHQHNFSGTSTNERRDMSNGSQVHESHDQVAGGHSSQESTRSDSFYKDGVNESSGRFGRKARIAESSSLISLVQSMNGGGYGQLKSLTGRSFFLPFSLSPSASMGSQRGGADVNGGITLTFLHVQSDPYAPGSQIEIEMPLPFSVTPLIFDHPLKDGSHSEEEEMKKKSTLSNERFDLLRLVAAEDYLLRAWKKALYEGLVEEEEEDTENAKSNHEETPSHKSRYVDAKQPRFHKHGSVEVMRISPHVIPRSAAQLEPMTSTLRFYCRMKLPGHGRRIDGHGIIRLLREELIRSTAQLWSFLKSNIKEKETAMQQMRSFMDHIHDQEWLRSQLLPSGLCAFVINGSILPRAAGNSDQPLPVSSPAHRNQGVAISTGGAVPFQSPPSLERSFTLPCSKRTITGMGLPKSGLTLIAGGGFHGKSTLLRALELGIYNHIPEDGRGFVVTDPTAVKIRAEDRRSVHGVNIESFITNLPFEKDTSNFVTSDASGSTSQAANIMEALELGSHTLLLDEDTSATNLMYRDPLVKALVPVEDEPITSLVDRIPALVKSKGVSVVMVVGGSGQYFQHADVVLVMKNYITRDATEEARSIAKSHVAHLSESDATAAAVQDPFTFSTRHVVHSSTFSSVGRSFLNQQSQAAYHRGGYRGSGGRDGGRIKVSASSTERIRFATEDIDLGLVEQLVEEGQLQSIAQCLAMCYDKGERWVEDAQRNGNDDEHSVEANRMFLSDVFVEQRGAVPSLVSPLLVVQQKDVSQHRPEALFPLGDVSDFSRLIWHCERVLRVSQLELNTPSSHIPRGFASLPRVMEIGAALNRLRTLRTKRFP